MDFSNAISLIADVLSATGTTIDISKYDGLIVKKLEASNTLDEGRSTNQTHIAITGAQMDIFPYIRADGYFNDAVSNADLKKYFIPQIPVCIHKSNCDYLGNDSSTGVLFTGEFVEGKTSVVRSKRKNAADQIQVSLINFDSQDFVSFRKLLHAGSYLILLKKSKQFKYDAFGIIPGKGIDADGGLHQLNNQFFKLATNTVVDASTGADDSNREAFTSQKSKPTFRTGYHSNFARNRILFGAPGTGKSFTLNCEKDQLLANGGEYERVTFHPDYSYANFVGTYKPVPCKDDQGHDAITYAYVPGPFVRTYVKALQNSRTDAPKPFLLVIEEINRANVAAVFGDVFQLLDRGDDEVSEYPIQASEDIRKYLAGELGGDPDDYAEIRIPDNMFIWATMNSADQGVFPMDTAFKRRWDFTYLGIDDSEAGIVGKKVILGQGEYQRTVEWNALRKAINGELLTYKVNEDKLMGPYFIAKKNLPEGDTIEPATFTRIFKNKVLMYLFDDAAKQKRPSLFAGCKDENKNLYSQICKEFDTKGVFIFCTKISDRFLPKDDGE